VKRISLVDRASKAEVDRFSKDIAAVAAQKLTGEGFLMAPARIARTGVQEYSALELGLEASQRMVRLYRPADQVFAPDTVASFEGQTITYYHPENGVDASNWKSVAVGDFHNVAQDPEDKTFLCADLIVRDKNAVESVSYGVKELSCGYSFELDMTPGTTPEGEAYDGIQKDIRGNHLAIVYAGRCGAGCAVGDCAGNEACACQARGTTNPKPGDSIMRKITVDGIDITLEETNAALVEKALAAKDTAIATQTKRATDAEGALGAQGEAMKKLAADHSAKVAELEAKIKTPEQQKAELAELVKVTGDAKAIAPEFVVDGLTAEEIRVGVVAHVIAKDEARKGVVVAILGGSDPAKLSSAIVRGAFDAALALKSGSAVGDSAYEQQVNDALSGAGGRTPGGKDGKEWTGQEIYNYRLQHGGKNPPNYAG
jgi:hypothetical protein